MEFLVCGRYNIRLAGFKDKFEFFTGIYSLVGQVYKIEVVVFGELDEGIQKGWKISFIYFLVCGQGKGVVEVDLGVQGFVVSCGYRFRLFVF